MRGAELDEWSKEELSVFVALEESKGRSRCVKWGGGLSALDQYQECLYDLIESTQCSSGGDIFLSKKLDVAPV